MHRQENSVEPSTERGNPRFGRAAHFSVGGVWLLSLALALIVRFEGVGVDPVLAVALLVTAIIAGLTLGIYALIAMLVWFGFS